MSLSYNGNKNPIEPLMTALFLLPLLLLMFASVFSPHKPIETGNIPAIESAEAYRTFLFAAIYAMAALLVLIRPAEALRLALHHKIYIIFLFYVIWTANWSLYPDKVIIMWGHFVGVYLSCLAALLAPGLVKENFLKVVMSFAVFYVVTTLLLVVVYPSRGIMDVDGIKRWIGLTNSPNTLGMAMTVAIWGALAAMYHYRSRLVQGLLLLLLVAAGICLYGSDSMTSALLSAAAIMMMPVLMRFTRLSVFWNVFLFFSIAIGFFVLFLAYYSIHPEFQLQKSLLGNLTYIGRTATFTGRTDLWKNAVLAIADKPFLGWGFDALFSASDVFHVSRRHLHNGYLEMMVAGGIFALVLLVAMIFQVVVRLIRLLRTDARWGVSLSILLLLILLHNMAESNFGRTSILWIVFSLMYLGIIPKTSDRPVILVHGHTDKKMAHAGGTLPLDRNVHSGRRRVRV